jgi:hypothetical protein
MRVRGQVLKDLTSYWRQIHDGIYFFVSKKTFMILTHLFLELRVKKVIIRLESNPAGAGSGKRATLLLAAKITRILFIKIDQSVLSNEIAVTLPATGEYLITVAEQPKMAKGERYRGAYCLSLESSPEIMQTLKPALWVE